LRAKTWIGLLALLVILSPLAFSQSRDTGALIGKIADEEGNGLPGVNVTLTSPNLMGARATISDAGGFYRFPALPPGEYNLKADLQGFATAVREAIRVTTTTTLNIDLTMKPSAVSEEITVVAQSPTVDVKSTETASVTLSNEILRNIPYNQFTADIVNLAPGVDNNVAFGASQNTGIAYTMDGVNVADPEAGSAWVFMDHNSIEEAKVMGIGLPAEYGNFTGVIFNLVTKSGGNEFSGHFEFVYQGKKSDAPKGLWQTDNNGAFLEDFPELTSPLNKLLDVGGHLGGPIKKDKLWFYVGTQYYRSQNYVTGFTEPVDYKQPRLFTKITSQLTPSLNLNVSLEVDTYVGINRGAGSTVALDAVVDQDSPEIVGNFSLTKILSPKTFFDLKGAFFTGYYYLDPEVGMDPYMHFSYDENFQYYSSGYFFYADRTRYQLNGSLSHYTEDFIKGAHDFKFGVEAEYSKVRNRYGYSGKGGPLGNAVKYFDYYGQPYLAYQYEGYDTNTRYARVEAFAQDSWQISSRLNINLGLRLSQNWGFVKDVDGTIYNTTRLAPRVGLTFDLFGDKSTVFKAHYGQFTEAMLSSFHDRFNPDSAYKDYVGFYWTGSAWEEMYRVVHESLYKMDPDIKHPYMDQVTVGLERELFRDTSLGVTFIYRKWNNIIGRYDRAAQYNPVEVYSAALDKTFTIYERTEDSMGNYDYLLTNISKGGLILEDPYRKYTGVEVLFNKRFSNRWQLLASYVYGQATGTMDNGFADDIGYGGNVDDPNFWINSDGNSTFDPTHMLKLQGTYILPFDISFNAYFRLITGDAWTTRVRTRALNQGRVTFFAEKRGSNHYPAEKTLDLRLEKIFTLASKYKLGLIVDIFNVFNNDTITSWGTRIGYDWNEGDYPSTDGHELYGIVRPRQARVGIRLIF
jgi:hypothetical protein